MTLQKTATHILITLLLSACSMDRHHELDSVQSLSEKSGIEMVVIDEAEKIRGTNATRLVRRFIGSSYVDDPIKSSIRQEFPRSKTVELPGISFEVRQDIIEELVDTLNKRFAYRNCLAFISNDSTREDKKQTISIIHATDKYNILRLQETSGGNYLFSTDSLITKLQHFEQKYPFQFIGVGDDWILIKTLNTLKDWNDFAKEVLKVCPNEETSTEDLAKALQKDNGKVSMWWD
jgi:hypothetical protein